MRYLLDESLVPVVAEALRLVGHEFHSVQEVFEGRQGVKDPEIIDWCRTNDAVWVHDDPASRRMHQREIQQSGIRTLLIPRPKGGLDMKHQLRVISGVLPELEARLRQEPSVRHYKASAPAPAQRRGEYFTHFPSPRLSKL